MVPERYRLPAIARVLLEQFELRRPGIREWTPEVEAQLRAASEAELQQIEQQAKDLDSYEADYFQRLRRVIDEILLPRYAAIAREEIALAKRDYGIWRGGDLVARATFAAAGFILGIIVVEVPYIPITAKWFPALTLIAGPVFPDVVMWWYRRRLRKKLDTLVDDLAKASETLEAYRPLTELSASPAPLRDDLAEAPAVAQRERSH